MNLDKLKEAEKEFFKRYPGGFAHPEMQKIVQKHRPEKMSALAQTSFAKEKFKDPIQIVESMIQIVSRSSMISLFEKPAFRDFAKSLGPTERERLALGLGEFLHADEEMGFGMLVDVLKKGKLAKWPIVTVVPVYFRPRKEVFIKPTAAKGIIQHFEIDGLQYKPTPTYAFYKGYRAAINKMKKEVEASLSPDNAAFCGFLMMSMERLIADGNQPYTNSKSKIE